MVSLQELPKKVQYITVDSKFVTGTNNTFSIDLNLTANTHVSDMSKVCGFKVVDFYVTQVGTTSSGAGNGAKFTQSRTDSRRASWSNTHSNTFRKTI